MNKYVAERLPPLLPTKVEDLLTNEKTFTSKGDVEVVAKLYRTFFRSRYQNHGGVGVRDPVNMNFGSRCHRMVAHVLRTNMVEHAHDPEGLHRN